MQIKLFELRDKMTFMVIMAVKMEPGNTSEDFLIRRAVHTISSVILIHAATLKEVVYGGRMKSAYDFIKESFDVLASGSVVDNEFILREVQEPKRSERHD